MNDIQRDALAINRRVLFQRGATGIGTAALASLLGSSSLAADREPGSQIAPRAKRVIYLFQSGGPAQQDLFDYKPALNKLNGEELPASVLGEQRLTGMGKQVA